MCPCQADEDRVPWLKINGFVQHVINRSGYAACQQLDLSVCDSELPLIGSFIYSFAVSSRAREACNVAIEVSHKGQGGNVRDLSGTG
jgi:hypothetical protein